MCEILRGILFIVWAGNDTVKEAEKWTFKSSQKSALLWLKNHNFSDT